MSLPIRNSVKVLLLNDKNEILLMCADDPRITSKDGKHFGRFWFPIGGGIEKDESIEDAAIREIYEETGLKKEEVELGPIVWFGEFDLTFVGTLSRIKEIFIVAKAKRSNVSLTNLDDWEKKVVQGIAWFSLEKIKNSDEIIFPVLLDKYLPDIIKGKYPEKPIEIDLRKQPEKRIFGGENIRNEILHFLEENNIKFKLLKHKPALTSDLGSELTNIPKEKSIKSLMLKGKKTNKNYLVAILGHQKLDMKAISSITGEKCELEKSEIMQKKYGINIGGVAPFGNLLNLETYFDTNILNQKTCITGSGLETESIILDSKDLIELVKPKVESFAK